MNQFRIKGYRMFYCNRKRGITQARGRNSGGILVYVKDCVTAVSVYKTSLESIMWLKVGNGSRKLSEQVFMGICYCPPERSKFTNTDFWEQLETDVAGLPNAESVILMGDFNARTGHIQDYITDSVDDWEAYFSPNAACKSQMEQANQDKKETYYGQCLVELCLKADLRILNGRLFKDKGLGQLSSTAPCTRYSSQSIE